MWPWVRDTDGLLDEVEGFSTGVCHAVEVDRLLVTGLLTDIVDSTQKVAELGDHPLAGGSRKAELAWLPLASPDEVLVFGQ